MRENGTWGHKMKHPSNRELFDYWNKRRGTRRAPERADIEPSGIRNILGDTFVLEGKEGHRFRIAGTRLCARSPGDARGDRARLFQGDEDAGVQVGARHHVRAALDRRAFQVASVLLRSGVRLP